MTRILLLFVTASCVCLVASLHAQQQKQIQSPLQLLDEQSKNIDDNLAELVVMLTELEAKTRDFETKIAKQIESGESISERLAVLKDALKQIQPHLSATETVELNGKEYAPDVLVSMAKSLVSVYEKESRNEATCQVLVREYEKTLLQLRTQHESGRVAMVTLNNKRSELETLKQQVGAEPVAAEEEWIPLFNGEDLNGWTPKIRGYDLGDNFGNTFRVEDGLLKVGYDAYEDGFRNRFGHLFYKEKLSNYVLRVEYRFVGDQVDGGPGWAIRNSGVMLHCQDPASMGKNQNFPVSIEMQMLGGDGTNDRSNANVCTPGTHIEMDGKLITAHCRNSASETFHGDQWVTVEIEVRGDEVIRHIIDGVVVLEYQKPRFDPNDDNAKDLIVDGNVRLTEGYFSLQSESHPVEFRKVELKRLDD